MLRFMIAGIMPEESTNIRCSAYGYHDYEAPTAILNPGVYNTIELYPVFEKEVQLEQSGD